MRFFLILEETALGGSCTIPDSEILPILSYGRLGHNPYKRGIGECL